MISDPTELLRALNPEPAARAPAVDMLWRRLDADGAIAEEPGDAVGQWRRGPAWASRMLAVGLAAVAIAIGVGAVLVLHYGRTAAGPPVAHGTIPPASRGLVGILGVLRRPQTAADRNLGSDLTRGALILRATVPVMSLARAAGVTVGGRKVVLVPVRPPVGELWPTPGPAGGGSTGLRLALFSGGGGCCSTPAEIEAGQAWSSFGSGAGNYVVLVVPDGVARVTIGLTRRVTVAVHDNVAAFRVPQPVENLGVYPMTWFGPSGKVLKKFAPPHKVVETVTSAVRVQVRVARSDRYCTTPRDERIELCPKSPHGVIRLGGQSSQWLVMFSFDAPRSTPAAGRTYYYFTVDAPEGCPNASQFGEENQAVTMGQRVVLRAAVDQRCPGRGHGTISLMTARSANHFPGQGVARPVGTFAFVIPRVAARTSH
jgi:hypothetical protein